jgi:hypothetical protein
MQVLNSILYEKDIDLLIETINESETLIFDKPISDIIKKYKLKIIDLGIYNDYIELIPKLKKIFESDVNINNNILESVKENLDKMSLESIKWLINNENEIFINMLTKIDLQKFINFIKSDKFIPIYKLMQLNDNIFDTFKNKIINLLDSKFFSSSSWFIPGNFEIFNDYEKIILMVELYINYKKKKLITDDKHVHLKMINILLKNNFILKTIINYQNYYKIKDNQLKDYFEKNNIIENFIKNTSVEVINWFFEIASVLVVIKSSNYKNIFKQVCTGGNLESIKLVYNLIQCAGYKIDNITLQQIMYELINNERWNNNKKQNEDVIFEIVNMGIKPPSGLSKYNDYYKNITLIKK